MSTDTASDRAGESARGGIPAATRRYEPPRVIPAGNLRDLVAEGGSGIMRLEQIDDRERGYRR